MRIDMQTFRMTQDNCTERRQNAMIVLKNRGKRVLKFYPAGRDAFVSKLKAWIETLQSELHDFIIYMIYSYLCYQASGCSPASRSQVSCLCHMAS